MGDVVKFGKLRSFDFSDGEYAELERIAQRANKTLPELLQDVLDELARMEAKGELKAHLARLAERITPRA